MSITNKVTVGLVSIAFAFSIVSSVPVNAQSDEASLQAQIAQLLEQIQELQAQNSSTTTVVASGGNAACPYTWTNNLSIGSSGDDVRQLQRFLNGNPQTQVATSGVGSPGNETSYYGPATARAVSRFQEMHAAQILTPLGLTQGTGGFYTSTRGQANSLCTSGSDSRTYTTRSSTGPQSATSAPVVQVTGDALAVTPGNPISDAYVVEGAQRAPYTSVVLTAGNDDVRVESVRIKRFGLSSSDNFDTVALVDASGVQIGTARSLNSRDEVSLGGNLIIPANRSVTLAIVGNMTSGGDFSAGSIAGLEIAEVIADTRVQGNFPIRGAAHVLSDSITLQKAVVEVSGGGDDIEFNRDTEVAAVTIDLSGSGADEEDSYLRSIILKQEGSADLDELGDIEVYVDEERSDYTLTIERDRFIINFGGRGILIEENDSVEVTLEVNTNEGYEEDVQFKLEDTSDVYVVGASYGYGLPVEIEYKVVRDCDDRKDTCEETNDGLKDTSEPSDILSGKVRDGGRLSKFEDEVRYGDDVILGALSVEFEGEDIEMEDLTFEVTLDRFSWISVSDNAWEDAEEDTVRLENVHLRIDGQTVAYADDGSIDFDEPSGSDAIIISNIDFSDNFIIDVRDETEVVFEVVADLDEAWSYFNKATIEFTLTSVDLAEGARSERDYTDTDEYFASNRTFEEVEIVGNEVTFSISSRGMDGEDFVAGKEDVIFGTLEVDASDAIDDIELENLYISFTIPIRQTGDLSNIESCRIIDESGDEVADSSSRLSGNAAESKDQMKFRFDDAVVESEDNMEFDILCDIDTDAVAGQQYQIVSDTSANDRIDYSIDRDDQEYLFGSGDDSDAISISASGELAVDTGTPDNESVVAYAITRDSNSIETLEITLEAEDEDMNIIDIYLAGVDIGVGEVSEDEIDEIIQKISINGIGADADANDFLDAHKIEVGECEDTEADCTETDGDVSITNAIEFSRVNRVIEEGDEVTVTMDIDYDTINTNKNRTRSGQWLEATTLYVVYEGEDSGVRRVGQDTISNHFVKNIVFPAIPTISTTDRDEDLRNDSDTTIYEFTITADGDNDIYVKQVGINVTNLTSGVTLGNVTVKQGGDESESISLSSGVTKFEFEEAVRIHAGKSETFEVEADISGVEDNSSVTVKLATDTAQRTVLGQAYDASLGNFVWSPNTLGERDDFDGDNTDWFSGWALFESDDIEGWTWNEND